MKCNRCPDRAHYPPHHVLYGNRKGKRAPKEIKRFVNEPINLQNLCLPCHTKYQPSYENRKHWFGQVYGPELLEWHERTPEKLKHDTRYTELEQMIKRKK